MVTAAVTRLHQRERLPAISPSMSGGPRPVGPSGVAVTTVTSGASLELTSDPGRAQAASALGTVPAAWPRHGCKEPRLLPSTNCVRSLKLDLKPKKRKAFWKQQTEQTLRIWRSRLRVSIRRVQVYVFASVGLSGGHVGVRGWEMNRYVTRSPRLASFLSIC